MPKISIIDSWTIPASGTKLENDITIKADVVYNITRHTHAGADPEQLIMSVKNVRSLPDGRYQIIPMVVFGESTFWQPEENDIVYSGEIESIFPVYIERKSLDRRPRPKSPDPFTFEFFSTKTNRTFGIRVDEEQLVSITIKTEHGSGNYSYLGHIRSYSDGIITIQTLQNSSGVFHIEDVSIRADSIRAIYFYSLTPIPYEEGIAKRRARHERIHQRDLKKIRKAVERTVKAGPDFIATVDGDKLVDLEPVDKKEDPFPEE